MTWQSSQGKATDPAYRTLVLNFALIAAAPGSDRERAICLQHVLNMNPAVLKMEPLIGGSC